MKTKHFFITLLALASRIGIAQISDSNLIQLDTLTITATRNEKSIYDAGRSITIISSEQIKNSGATSLAEVLSAQEGIYVLGTGQNPGQFQNIFSRGANANHTIILIDGVKISDPTSPDNGMDLSELSLLNIEKIEIVRGSHSSMYGSSAIGSVINIITKKNNKQGLNVSAALYGGVFGANTFSFAENLQLNYTFKNGLYANAGLYNINVNGIDATVDTVINSTNYIHNNREQDGFKKLDYFGTIGIKKEKSNAFFSYKHSGQQSDVDDGAFKDDENYTIDVNRDLISYSLKYLFSDRFSITAAGGFTKLNRIAIDDSSVIDYNNITDQSYSEANYSGSVSNNEALAMYAVKGANITAGVGILNEKMTFDTYYFSSALGLELKTNLDSLNINVSTYSQFINADLSGELFDSNWSAFRLGLSARNTQHEIFKNNFTYEVNPSVKVSKNALIYYSYATGFNAPSLYQLYSPEMDFMSGITRGNLKLKPEKSTTNEVGIKQKIGNKINYSVSLFSSMVSNTINYVYLWDGSVPIDSLSYLDYKGDTYINTGTQLNYGIELMLAVNITDKIVVKGNMSYIKGKSDFNIEGIDRAHVKNNHIQLYNNGVFLNNETKSIELTRRPTTANISIEYEISKKIYSTVQVKYVGKRNDIYYNSALGPYGALSNKGMKDYTITELGVRYNILKSLSVQVRAENIFNVNYNEIFGYAARGRGYYLCVRYVM